jgi:hypothetical protein
VLVEPGAFVCDDADEAAELARAVGFSPATEIERYEIPYRTVGDEVATYVVDADFLTLWLRHPLFAWSSSTRWAARLAR